MTAERAAAFGRVHRHAACSDVVMTRMHRWAFVALLTVGIADGAPAADPIAAEDDYSYLAVISGACEQLVVDDRSVTTCADKLVNVDFGNGRVAFMFSGRDGGTTVVTTFSGGASEQPGARDYHLTVDRMSTTTVAPGSASPATVVVAAAGTCTMRGDPTHEQARFECRVKSAGKETVGRFRTSGSPTVHAGARAPGPTRTALKTTRRTRRPPSYGSSALDPALRAGWAGLELYTQIKTVWTNLGRHSRPPVARLPVARRRSPAAD